MRPLLIPVCQSLDWHRHQVDGDIGKDRSTFCQPSGRERPHRNPFHPELKVVLVAECLQFRRDQKQIRSHRKHVEQNHRSTGPINIVSFCDMRSDLLLVILRAREVIERVKRQRREEHTTTESVEVTDDRFLNKRITVRIKRKQRYAERRQTSKVCRPALDPIVTR